jgi:hypothetical protein
VTHDRLVQRVSQEQDDILERPLVRGDDLLEARLFEQLVDLLVEGLFLDLRELPRGLGAAGGLRGGAGLSG